MAQKKGFDGKAFRNLLLAGGRSEVQLAYRTLFVYFMPRLRWRFASAGVKLEDRDDLAQEALMVVVKDWAKIDDPQATEGWIYTVADRYVAKYWANRSRAERVFVDLPPEPGDEPDDMCGVEEHWLAMRHLANEDPDVAIAVRQGLEKLRQLDEMTLQLLVWMAEGATYEEIGEWLGCDVAAARERVSKAMQRALRFIAPAVPTASLRALKRGVTDKLRTDLDLISGVRKPEAGPTCDLSNRLKPSADVEPRAMDQGSTGS